MIFQAVLASLAIAFVPILFEPSEALDAAKRTAKVTIENMARGVNLLIADFVHVAKVGLFPLNLSKAAEQTAPSTNDETVVMITPIIITTAHPAMVVLFSKDPEDEEL